MPTNIGPRIGIEGEAAFKRQLAEINTGLKTTKTEMQAVTSAFIGNEKSVEALTAQNAVLEKSSYSLTEKLRAQQEMLRRYAQSYGEADARTQRWQQEVNRTTAELNRVNAAMRQNNEQLGQQGGFLDKLGIDLPALAQKFGLPTGAAEKLTEALGSGSLAAGAFGAAAVKLGTELVRLSDQATAYADEIATMSNNYAIAVQDLQKLQYMAELTDVSVETVTGSMSRLVRSMDSARDGTGATADAFARLGVNVTSSNGGLRTANEVFMEAIDRLGQISNQTERDALAMQIFGKSAQELNSIIKLGSEGLAEYAAQAEQSGYVLSDKMISILTDGDDATQRLDKAMEGLGNTVGTIVTPVIAGWKLVLAEAAEGTSNFIQQLFGLKDAATEARDALDGTRSTIRDMTADDFMTPQEQYDAYVEKTRSLMGRNAMTVQFNITSEIDGQVLAHNQYRYNLDEGNRRGPSMVQ